MHLHMHSPAMFWPECDKPSCAGRSPKHDSFSRSDRRGQTYVRIIGATGASRGRAFSRPDWGSERGRAGVAWGHPGAYAPGYELSPLRGWGKHR